jgi:hypothetical protein
MHWTKGIRPRVLWCGFNVALLTLLSLSVSANADDLLKKADPATVPLLTYLWVGIFSMLGWSAASLSVLAGWHDGDIAVRLEILQGIFASLGAGICAFFLSKIAGQSEMLSYMLVMAGGFGGERALRRFFERAKDKSEP